MASITTRRRKDGSVSYYVRHTTGDGRRRWEQFDRLKDAHERRAEVEHLGARSRGTWSPPPKVTFAEYAHTWLATKAHLRERTRFEYQRLLDRELLPRFGTLRLEAIRRSDIKAFAAGQAARGLARNTVRNQVAVLHAILASAVDDELLTANVAAGIKRPGRKAKQIQPPTPAEVQHLLTKADPAARRPITLAASCGLRRGEIFGLQWADIDFEQRLIRVRRSNRDGVLGPTKTEAGERLVPMFGSSRLALLEHRAHSRYTEPADFVFTNADGEAELPNTWIRREFYPARKAAGLPDLRFHDLRHFAVSQLIAQGADILQVARVAGHADPSITLRVYSHLMAAGLAEAAARYDPLASSR
jgi:integrase